MSALLETVRQVAVADDGQDLVEYGLLGLFVALAGVAVWNAIVLALGTSYGGYDSGVQALWEPLDP